MAGGLIVSEVQGLGATLPQVGLAETIYVNSDLLKVVPIFPGNSSGGHIYNEETVLPQGGPVPLNSGQVPQGQLRTTQRTVSYKYFGGDVPIDPRLAPLTASIQDIYKLTVSKQIKRLAMDLDRDIVQGMVSSDANNFNGFRGLAAATTDLTVSVDFGGAAVTKRGTDKMWNKLHSAARPTAVWVCMGDTEVDIREFLGTHANAADKMSGAFGRPMLHLHDRPVLVSENVTANEDAAGAVHATETKCSLYLVGFDPSGDQGVFGIVPPRSELALSADLLGPAGSLIHRISRVMFSFAMALPSKFWLIRGFNIVNS